MTGIRKVAWTLMVPLTLLVSGCGGGGGTNSTPPPVVTPPPTYSKFSELTGTQTFDTAGVSNVYDQYGAGPAAAVAVRNFGNYITYTFDFTAGSITVNEPGQPAITFDATNKDLDNDKFVVYEKEGSPNVINQFIMRFPSINGVPLSYTRYGSFNFNNISDQTRPNFGGSQLVYGVATKPGDTPLSGSAHYTASIVDGGFNSVSGGDFYGFSESKSTANFSANFGAGTISTDMHMIGERSGGDEMDFGTVNGSGTIVSGGPGFSGNLSGSATGEFSGAFFGPQAAEMGYTFFVTNLDGSGGGTVVGIK